MRNSAFILSSFFFFWFWILAAFSFLSFLISRSAWYPDKWLTSNFHAKKNYFFFQLPMAHLLLFSKSRLSLQWGEKNYRTIAKWEGGGVRDRKKHCLLHTSCMFLSLACIHTAVWFILLFEALTTNFSPTWSFKISSWKFLQNLGLILNFALPYQDLSGFCCLANTTAKENTFLCLSVR